MNATNLTLEEYERIEPKTAVKFRGERLQFWTPNTLTQLRAQSLFGPGLPMSERETVRWINSMCSDDVLIDIGANVGTYTIFAAKRGVKVLAIEPEASNYHALCRNVRQNKVDAGVVAICAGLSNVTKLDRLYVANLGTGQSCHSLGVNETPTGEFFDVAERHTQSIMSYRLDDMLTSIFEEEPTHIKLDVDGIELKVVQGMLETLDSPKLKSVLIELTPDHPEHNQIRDIMSAKGFNLSAEQEEESTVKQGPWQGLCNVIFFRPQESAITKLWPPITTFDHKAQTLSPTASERLYSKVSEAEIVVSPTPHFVAEDVFSQEDYELILKNIPEADLYCNITEMGWTLGDTQRVVFPFRDDFLSLLSERHDAFLRSFMAVAQGDQLLTLTANRFSPWIPELSSNAYVDGFSIESLLSKDFEGYKIGPHTDSVNRVLSLLYYLPESDACADSGTSLYVPRDRNFECAGGPHYKFEGFEEVVKIPFKPNTLFGFVKTTSSFHGVPPIPKASIDRNILHVTLHLASRDNA